MSCCSSEFIDYCDALRYTTHRYIKNCIDTSITILHIAIRRCIDVSSHLYTVLICVRSYHDIAPYYDTRMYHYCIAGMFGRAEVCCIKCDWQKRFGEYA